MVNKKPTKKNKPAKKVSKKTLPKKEAKKETKSAKISKENPKKKNSSSFEVFKGKYFYGLGRRKTSVSQVRIYPKGKGDIYVNGKKLEEYTNDAVTATRRIKKPLEVVGMEKNFNVSIRVKGGGFKGQLEAIQLGIGRALLAFDEELKKPLRENEFLTRDSRMVERKKPGLKKARRAPQWSKR